VTIDVFRPSCVHLQGGMSKNENVFIMCWDQASVKIICSWLTLNLPTTTIVAQPFNVIKWQLKFNPVAKGLKFWLNGKTVVSIKYYKLLETTIYHF